MINQTRMCIYVSSPQSYKDVLDVFMDCKRKNWSNCPYPLVVSTNWNLEYPDAVIINSGNLNDSWVERSLDALKTLDYEYVMMLCDDIFITEEFDNRIIEEILDYMDFNKINYCRMRPLHSKKPIGELPYMSYVNQNTPYGINLQCGIFRREFLINLIGDGTKSAWDIEGMLLERAAKADDTPFSDVIACNRNVFSVVHGIEKGKWYPSALKQLSKNEIKVVSNRAKISAMEEYKKNIISFVVERLSPSTRTKIKHLAQKLGCRFVNQN